MQFEDRLFICNRLGRFLEVPLPHIFSKLRRNELLKPLLLSHFRRQDAMQITLTSKISLKETTLNSDLTS